MLGDVAEQRLRVVGLRQTQRLVILGTNHLANINAQPLMKLGQRVGAGRIFQVFDDGRLDASVAQQL